MRTLSDLELRALLQEMADLEAELMVKGRRLKAHIAALRSDLREVKS